MRSRALPVFILVVGLALLAAWAVVAKEPEPSRLSSEAEALSAALSAMGARDFKKDRLVKDEAALTPTWWSGGPIGAAINAIAFDPVMSRILYVATAGGGLYRSTDGGDTWDDTPNDPSQGLNLGQGHGRVRDVVTAEGVVYAATTGHERFHWSTDGGDTWSHASGGSWWVDDLAVHPTVTTTLYVAGDDVYISTNGGQSWFLSSTGMDPDDWTWDLAINPVTPTVIYAASYGKVYKTDDGGAHWSNTGSGLPSQMVWKVAVNPLTPTIVYAGLDAEGVWRSEDDGTTWSQWSGSGIHCPVREIVVDPADPNTVYIGTDDMGVYRRSEEDPFWTHLGPFYTTGQRRVYAIGMTANAPGTVFAGVWGDGIYKSTNGGQSWQPRNENLSAMRINRIAADPNHPGTAYATARGGLFRTADGGETWARIRDAGTWLYGDAYGLAIDDSTSTVYVGMHASIITTTDGTNWYDASSGLPAAVVWDIAINPITPTTVYAAQYWGNTSEIGVYRSENGGTSWTRASSGITDTNITALAIDPSNPQIIYIGTEQGNVFRSDDGGDSWNWSGSGLVIQSGWPTIWDIVPDPEAAGVVYLAQSNDGVSSQGGIYKSTDYGVTWERVLEGHDPQALVIDPVDHDVLITASWNDYLYRSEDDSDTWSVYDADAFTGYRYVQALAVGPTENGWRLYAGTATNSIWQRDIRTDFTIYLPLVNKEHSPPVDSDHDGLSDDEERVKYLTNPNLADTDGDGIPDGDWDERREYVYTVRVLMKIRQPFDVQAMNDWYQDVRIVDGPDLDGYTDIEAIIYPDTVVDYSPSGFPVSDLPNGFQMYTEPGIATNYSPSMQSEVLQILEGADTDEEAVSQVLQWVTDETTFYLDDSIPEVYYTYVEDGEVKVRNYDGPLPVDELLQTHYFADSMFEMRTHGTCTSIATLKCAMLKAAGIPCRVIQTIFPIYYHEDQTVPYANNLTREWHCMYEQPSGQSPWWCNHAFLEVYLGGRWVRADWTVNVRHEDPLCLSLKIVSVSDWSEVDFSQTWPVDWIDERPYYTLLLEDQEPQH